MIRRLLKTLAILAVLAVIGLGTGAALEEWDRRAALSAKPAFAVDRIVVEKKARRMTLMHNGHVVRRYTVKLGFTPAGHKQQEGDGRTPVGTYSIDARNPRSSFHLSLRISYPDAKDKARAKAAGVPPGSDIFIHGEPNRIGWLLSLLGANGLIDRGDWTDGCIAVTNSEMREIWASVKTGTPIDIRP